MRRTVLIVPELLGDPNAESPLRQVLPALRTLAEAGTLVKVAPLPKVETPEALFLGLRPAEGQMRQGPLTVSALGADPPERSTHFHLSLLAYDGGTAGSIGYEAPDDEVRLVLEQAKKLNTRSLTLVPGEGVDHGLVWEGLGDLATTPASEAEGKPIRASLPEGDAEAMLRRFVDDSVNLLSELEFNQRRVDEGLPPLNLLWPWGHGVRRPVPNLFLRRGERAHVESASLRLAGLTRLTGYVHGDRQAFGRGVNTRLDALARRLREETVAIAVLDAPAALRSQGLEEELHWFVRQMNERLVAPLLEDALREPSRLTLLAPGSAVGLGVSLQSPSSSANAIPFDERALEERTLGTRDLAELVETGITL